MSDDSSFLHINSGKKTGDIDKGNQRDIKTVTETDKSARLYRRVRVEGAGQPIGLIGDNSCGHPVVTGKADNDILGLILLDFKKISVIHSRHNHLFHIIGLFGIFRYGCL